MAENETAGAPVSPAGPAGGPATPPKVLPWLVLHTIGRLGIFALLTLVLWMAGLDFFSGAIFGLLLSMPVAYLALRPSRERLSEALVARSMARRAEKEQLRDRLSGDQPAD
jgi:hypothetical protein